MFLINPIQWYVSSRNNDYIHKYNSSQSTNESNESMYTVRALLKQHNNESCIKLPSTTDQRPTNNDGLTKSENTHLFIQNSFCKRYPQKLQVTYKFLHSQLK